VKLLYKPLSLIAGLIAARAAKATFQAIWKRIDDREPPKPTTADATLRHVLTASVLEAGTKAGMAAMADRAAARTFNYLFGVWPGEKESKAKD
jgi:Protein of unknown function (DUF4235)